jgi:esterase/lipase
LEAVEEPVLMVVSDGDEAADPERAVEAFEGLHSAEKELLRVQDSSHQLLHDFDADQVSAALVAFLTAPR